MTICIRSGNYVNAVNITSTTTTNVWSQRFEVVPGLNYVFTMNIQVPANTYVQFYAYSFEDNAKEFTDAGKLEGYSRLANVETAEGEWRFVQGLRIYPRPADLSCSTLFTGNIRVIGEYKELKKIEFMKHGFGLVQALTDAL